MRKKFLLMTFLLAIIGFCGTSLSAQVGLQITTEQGLRDFAVSVNDGNSYYGEVVTLANDITLTGEWTPIGTGYRSSKSYSGNAFKGTFDGGDHTISGLKITSTTGDDVAIGLFGIVDGGTVKNLNLKDVSINVTNSDLAGAAIGMMLNGATADKITVSGTIVGHDGVGGIVGRLIIDGTISNCINNASVTSSYGGIGGIVGKPYYEDGTNTSTFASITNCINNGTVTAPMYVGGIAGLARANVTGCTNNGEVKGGTQTGGIIGQLIAAGTVSGNENKVKISGKNHLGGIIGDYSQSTAYTYNNVSIANNINRGELAATEQCAAIMGCNNIDGFTAMTATGNVSYYYVEGLELFGNPEDMVIDETNKFVVPVAQVGEQTFYTFAEAADAAQAGSEIKLLANIEGDITVPANVTLNGNGFAISGGILAEGDITFAGVTTAADFDANVANTAVNIPAGASLQLTGSARLVIGHGATFNITGTIEDAKTADKATLVPSLKIAAGASITGNGVTFNVNNAYIVANANTTSKNSNANGTLDFNIDNSIWEQTGVLAFHVPTSGKDPVVNFELKNSVLTTTSHLVFSVTKGEIVIDNSLVNQGTSRQIENRSTMTIKNGSVVNGAVATSSNAINPGTIIVENATYAVTGEFSGAAEGTGTLIIKKGANVSVGSIKAGANVTVDAEGMTAGDMINFTADLSQFTGTLSVINNDNLDAEIKDGKIVLVEKPVAKIGTTKYGTLQAAINAVQNGETITLLSNITEELVNIDKASGVAFTIDGKNNEFTGEFEIGIGENINIKDINFVASDEISPDYFIDCMDKNSNCVLTITGCNFTDTDYSTVAIGTHQPTQVVIDGCNATGVHSLLQNQGGYDITVKNTTVDGKRGMSLGTVKGATVENVTINAADDKYGIRLNGEITNNTITIKDCNITAFIPVVVRQAQVENYNVIFNGTNTMTPKNTDGLWCAIGTSEYETNGTMPTAPTGKVKVQLKDAGLSTEGLYGNYIYPVRISNNEYETLQAALTAANNMTGDVTVEIYGEVEFVNGIELNGNYSSISFIGKAENAKMTIKQTAGGDYLEAHGKTVAFTDLTLAKDNPAWSDNSAHMGNYFSLQGGTATYNECIFPNGACTSGGTATYTACTFQNSSEYGLWVYDDALVTVNGGTIDSKKGIKVYSEDETSITSTLTVENATFTENVTVKPAVAVGYAQSITLIGNTYNNPTAHVELDSGSDADCNGITFVAKDTEGNDIAPTLTVVNRSNNGAPCGVLVNGEIYTTVTAAAKEAKEGDKVTLLYDTTEEVVLSYGVVLDKNNHTADGVTVRTADLIITTAEQLIAFAKDVNEDGNNYNNGIIELGANINLNGNETNLWTPIGKNGDSNPKFKGTFDGKGYTISNLYVKQEAAYHAAGLFGATNGTIKNFTIDGAYVESLSSGSATVNGTAVVAGSTAYGATIENVHVKNATVKGNRYVAGIVGYMDGVVKDCSVENVTIVATPDKLSGSYDNGDKVGGIVGYTNSNATEIAGCELKGTVSIKGYRDIGGIVGTVQSSVVVTDNTNSATVSITVDQNTGYYGDKAANAGEFIGRGTASSESTNNTTAEGATCTVETIPFTPIAQIGDVKYNDLHEAMLAAKAGETVKLVNDVDLAGTVWEPVSFQGIFDGQDHIISNLTINKPGVSNTGFITSLNGTFKNVTFTNPTVTGGENTAVVAGRAGGAAALAENITINGTIKVETTHSGYARAGGIVGGWAYGNYKNITVDGGDKATSYIKHTGGGDGRYVAGIVGHADGVDSYTNCTVKNITISGGWLCGGIAGPGPSDDLVSGCSVENIDMGANYSGGMFGWYYGNGTVKDATVKNVTFTDGSANNGIIGGYSQNTDANVENLTYENVQNSNGAPLLDHVASIDDVNYFTFEAALDAVQDDETITLLNRTGSEISKEIEFTKDITFTITGTAPNYALPIVTFQNATVNIEDANFQIPELDARQNATINVINSTIVDAGGNSIVKSYYNGAINIDANSTVYAMQVTTMGYITVAGTLNATWQTNVYGNGLITLNEGATFNTAALQLTAQDYSGRDNTDAERVGKPAEILVDGANLTVGNVHSAGGADYSYNSSHGINVGTVDGKSAILNIKNGGNVNIHMANGETANIGAGGTVNIAASTLNTICRAENGTVTLANNGTVNVSGESTLNIQTLTGESIDFLDGAIINNSTIGGNVFVAGAVTFRGDNTFAMLYDYGTLTDYYGTTAPMKWNVEKGASVTLTNEARYGLGYGDEVTVIGNIENALTARENLSDDDRSLFMHGLVAQESSGWNCNSKLTVKNAYVVLGSNNSFGNKPGNYGGTYKFDFNNSVVDGSRITFYEADSQTEFTLTNSDVNIGTFMTRDADSKFILTGSKVLSTATTNGTDEGNYNAGELVLNNSSLTYNAAFTNTGVLNIGENSNVTAPTVIDNGTINFTSLTSILETATEGLVITLDSNYPDHKVVYKDGKYQVVEKDYVAQIDEDNKFETLHEAFNAAEDGQTIVVLKDITYTKANGSVNGEYIDGLVYTGDKSFTVDFGGYTITENGEINDYLVYLNNKGEKENEITFKNGKIAINAESNTTAWAAITVGSNSATHKTTLNLNDMEVVNGNPNNTSNQVIRTRNGATVNLNDETVVTSNGTSYGVVAQTGSTVNINSGAKVVHTNSGTTNGNVVYTAVSGNGTINIYDGATIESDKYAIHNMTSGNTVINIYGGTITAPVAVHVATNGGDGQTAVANISGGTFTGSLETYSNAASIVITGGRFSVDPSEYLAPGYEAVQIDENVYEVRLSSFEKFYTAEGVETTQDQAAYSLMFNVTDNENNELSVKIGNKPAKNSYSKLVIPAIVTLNDEDYKITSIPESAFASCQNFVGELVIPEYVESIGNYAFNTCHYSVADDKKGELVLNDGLKSIGAQAFKNSYFTDDLSIPASVETISANAFDHSTIAGTLTINGNMNSAGGFNNTDFTSLVVAEGVKTISEDAFKGMGALEEVHLPSTLTQIGRRAFGSDDNISKIISEATNAPELLYSENVEYYKHPFSQTVRENAVVLVPNYNEYISNAKWAEFEHIIGVGSEIEIAGKDDKYTMIATITSMDPMECSIKIGNTKPAANSNAELVLPEVVDFFPSVEGLDFTVTSIPEYAFKGCNNFVGNLVIPAAVRTIEYMAFSSSHNANAGSLIFADNRQLTTIGGWAFNNSFKGDFQLPASITSIGVSAFANNGAGNTLTITAENSGYGRAFAGSKFIKLVVEEGVKSLPGLAFLNTNFTEVVLPSTLETMNGSAFHNTKTITTITINAAVPPTVQNANNYNAFEQEVFDKATLFVPDHAAKALYREANVWKEFDKISTPIITQTTQLNAGWNWFSAYVETDLKELQDALGENGVQITSKTDGFVAYNSQYGWSGILSSITESQMYMINVGASHDLELSGELVGPTSITLHQGWNWIGFPMSEAVSVTDALAGFGAKPGDQIKSKDNGFASYNSQYGWGGTLSTLNPGEGYMYQSNNSETTELFYSAGTRGELKANVTTDGNHWIPNAGQYPNNMTMTAMVEVEGGDYEVAAFVNGECRGSARPIYIEALDAHILFLTIHGEDVEEMTFKFYDLATGEEFDLNDRMNYSNDAIVGTLAEPYIFSRGTTGIGEASLSDINIYPNPTTTGTEINLQATCDKVEVFNALGVKVAEYHNVDSIDAFETAGIYVIRITDNGDVKHCRLIVK